MPTLLVTRPAEDAQGLIDELAAMDIGAVAAPLMRVDYLDGPALDLSNTQGFLLTSANGVRALAARTDRRDVPAYAVGDATARAAIDAGFEKVQSAGGDVDDLAALIRETCDPDAGVLLHAAGSVVAGDLAAMLEPRGFQVWREMLYEAVPAAALPDAAKHALSAGALDGVILYSPRTARIFDALAAEAGLMTALKDLRLFALSDNVRRASNAPWRECIVSAAPDQRSLLRAVRSCYY